MNVYRSNAAIPAFAGRAGVAAAGRVGVVVRELPDSGLVFRLTQGRAWIAVLGTMLAGIVALNVISLGLTSTSGVTGQQIDELQRQNSALRGEIAEKLSATRIEAAAPSLGLSTPAAADITYLEYKPSDLAQAAKVLAGLVHSAAAAWSPPSQEEGATLIEPTAPTDSSVSTVSTGSTESVTESAAPTEAPEPTATTQAASSPSSTASGSDSGSGSGGVGTGL